MMNNGFRCRPVPVGQFRQRIRRKFQGAARDPAARPADVQRILPRLVRYLGHSPITPATRRNISPTSNTCSTHDESFSIYMAHGGTTFGFGPARTARSSPTPPATITTRRSAKPAGRRKSFSKPAICLPNIFCPAKPSPAPATNAVIATRRSKPRSPLPFLKICGSHRRSSSAIDGTIRSGLRLNSLSHHHSRGLQRGRIARGNGGAIKNFAVALVVFLHRLRIFIFDPLRQIFKDGRGLRGFDGRNGNHGVGRRDLGSVSPGKRYFEKRARVSKNFSVGQPASLMGAS